MGADIHGVVQTRWKSSEGPWFNEMSIEDNRSYFLFSILGDVRNYKGLPSIYPNRGLPKDFSYDQAEEFLGHFGDFMGDHSYTWYSLEEIRDWPHWSDLDEEGVTYADRCETFLAFLKWLELKYHWKDVRLVIGFDS